MGYKNLQTCVADLEKTGQLRRIDVEVDPYLELAAIQRRVYAAQGPALLFTNVKGSRFPVLTNLFGTLERSRFLFRDTLANLEKIFKLKADPQDLFKHPVRYRGLAKTLWHLRPRWVRRAPVLAQEIKISDLPQIQCWPNDGGSFITLPQVYTESPNRPGIRHSNLGMYRIQISGNQYQAEREVGLHYQIHRGIGVHHQEALSQGKKLRVHIFAGGAPALSLAAVMPLPEGLPELYFAGALAGQRLPYYRAADGLAISAEADFCIVGSIDPTQVKAEGPFGDHLGYYSLAHDFPLLQVEKVYARQDAIWPCTSVGRPPQEDTSFGQLIHELTGPVIPTLIPGLRQVHAVDAAGVHPLLLAIGSERYTPYEPRLFPQELLTQANALLGQGQLSLAKYLWICAGEDAPELSAQNIPDFFAHVLERVDWRRDLHFQTCTTMDTLDYSGTALNQGSKLIIAAAGLKQRELGRQVLTDLTLPVGFKNPRLVLPGVLVLSGPPFRSDLSPSPYPLPSRERENSEERNSDLQRLSLFLSSQSSLKAFPLIVLVDDSDFVSQNLNNFLWVTFTRSNPASDIAGIGEFIWQKHWGCLGSLIIDARIKPQHAPSLEEDPKIQRKIESWGASNGPLQQII